MDGTKFKLDLNLQNLSMISIATKLWDSQDIKNRIKNNSSGHVREYLDKNWCEISKLVVEHANSLNLPASLSVLLNKTILLIGEKIYDWVFYVTQNLKLDLITTQKIYFTFNVVDEMKIFDLYWRNLMALDNFIYQSDYSEHSSLFLLACMFGCQRFVKERKNEMLDELCEFYPQIKTGDEIYNIMSVSICMTVKYEISENVPPPPQMFHICLEKGFSKAARFYWEKLDEVERVSNLTHFAKKCWRKDRVASFLMEKNCENLLFLINQMREEERYLFFADYADKIIELFLPVWPYRELIVDLLKYDWNIKSSVRMMDFWMWYSDNSIPLVFPQDNELRFQIMLKAWGNIPVDEKRIFLMKSPEMIYKLFSTLNPDILNLVLNDPSIREVYGKKIDYFIHNGFLDLAKMGKIDILNKLIKAITNFIPNGKEFLREYFGNNYIVRDLMAIDESFGLIDQFLDWSAESEAERPWFKNKINAISVCRCLTEPPFKSFKFELADKFLKWRLETDAEIKRFKEEMKSYNFVIVGSGKYVRIKSGDLSWLSPGDSLAIHPDEDPYDNADGVTFLKFEDATELNRGVVLGIKSFCFDEDYGFLGPACCHAEMRDVDYVGTKAGDFIVFNVRQIWVDSCNFYLHLDEIIDLSNAFIKLYYETDEEVLKFKKTKLHRLVTENLKEFLLEALEVRRQGRSLVGDNFLDEFFKFCMIPSEKIEEIKIQEQSDIEDFLDTYLIDQLKFNFVDNYLNILFGNVKKAEVYKKFWNSSNKAALLCVSYIKKFGEVSPFLNGYFLNIVFWLRMVDDMEKLKNDVFALHENIPKWFPVLLDKVKGQSPFDDVQRIHVIRLCD